MVFDVFVKLHALSMSSDLAKAQVSQLLPDSSDPLLRHMRDSIGTFFNASLQSQISTKDVVSCNDRPWRTTKYSIRRRRGSMSSGSRKSS
jgi:hypothetical protein